MLHSVKYISSFFFQLSVIKHAKTYIFISLITHSFMSIMLYWFYFMIISGREVSIPVIPVYAPSLVYTASKGLKDKYVLPVGSECVYGKWRGIDLHWREPPTHRERYRERTRWAGTCIQLFGNKRVRASFVNQTSTLYNDHEPHSFDWPVMRSTYNALLLVGM